MRRITLMGATALAAALAVTGLMGLLLRRLRKSHIDRPLRRTREALTDLAQGRVVSLEPVEPHNPATALESALAVRLQTIIEENRQALFRTSEVRAAHFDPQILQQIDAIAAPLLERHRQANERSRSDKSVRFNRKGIPLTRHMFLAGAAALICLSVGAFALVQSNQEAALRSQLDVLQVERIDHGVRCVESPALVARLAASREISAPRRPVLMRGASMRSPPPT